MHGYFIPTSWLVCSLSAGLAVFLSAFGVALFTKRTGRRGPAKLVLDALALLLGAAGLLVIAASAAACFFFSSGPLTVPSVFALLAALAFVASFLAYRKARSTGHVGALGYGLAAMFAWIAGAVSLLITAVSIAAVWGAA